MKKMKYITLVLMTAILMMTATGCFWLNPFPGPDETSESESQTDETETETERETEDDTYVPSIEQKGAPEFAVMDGQDEGVAVIINNSEEDQEAVIYKDDVSVTAFADRKDLEEDTTTELEDAYMALSDPEVWEKVSSEIDEQLAAKNVDMKAEDFIVSEIFYMMLDEKAVESVDFIGETMTSCFKINGIKKDDVVLLMQYIDGEWVVLEHSYAEVIEDGILKATMKTDLGAIAILTARAE